MDLLVRIGTTATVIPQFLPDLDYFGSEYGIAPSIGLHVPPRTRPALHGRVYESHSNSVFGARAFFQVGGLKPAHDNQYGFAVAASNWRSIWKVACLGASRISGRPAGFARNASRISARQRKVLPLPAGPRRNCACTAEFLTQRREEAKAQRNLISVFAWGKRKIQKSIC